MPERPAIDWDELKARVAGLSESLKGPEAMPPGRRAELLAARARLYASTEEARTAEMLEAVSFAVGNGAFAVEKRWVREVVALSEITTVPCTPVFVLGIVNLRGEMVSVIDLKRIFDLPGREKAPALLIVLESAEMCFALAADEITGVVAIEKGELKRLPTLTGARDEYLKGVTQGSLVLLDGERLLSDRSLTVFQASE